MSEDFDKEAEREKLREQFEAERERREATQQMSELLLKGATMTNKHCDTCGDPIFRHEGQEFCANCQTSAPADRGAAARDAPDAGAAGGEAADGRSASPDPDPADAPTATDRGADEVPVEAQSRRDPEPSGSPPSDSEPTGDVDTPSRRRDHAADATPSSGGTDPSAAADASAAPGNELDAPAALRRSLEKFSRLAAEADDPREAREHLAAAREAAEALDALRR